MASSIQNSALITTQDSKPWGNWPMKDYLKSGPHMTFMMHAVQKTNFSRGLAVPGLISAAVTKSSEARGLTVGVVGVDDADRGMAADCAASCCCRSYSTSSLRDANTFYNDNKHKQVIWHIFPSGTESMGDRGSKKAYTGPRTGIYLPTKFGCDRSIVVGCRSRNDRQTSRQTDKQNGMTIRLTLCERDAKHQSPNKVHISWLNTLLT